MSDSVFKCGRRKGFTTVYRDVAQDERLSLKARGLFLLMQSLPDDWNYTVAGLAKKAGAGKDQIRSGLKELLDVGYLVKEQTHNEAGKFAGNVYILQEEAPPLSGNPTTENPSTVFPLTENPTEHNKDKKNKEKKNPLPPVEVYDAIESYIGDDPEYREAFEGFLANRTAMKKPVRTARAINTIINRLRKVNHRETEIAMLDKATESNWLTVYALKEDELPQQGNRESEDRDGI